MIFPDVGLDEWKRRFDLDVIEAPCACCGKTFRTEIPILTHGHAGLATPVHECGPTFVEVVLTPKTDAARSFWESVVGQPPTST